LSAIRQGAQTRRPGAGRPAPTATSGAPRRDGRCVLEFCLTTGVKLRGPEGAQRLRATSASTSEFGSAGFRPSPHQRPLCSESCPISCGACCARLRQDRRSVPNDDPCELHQPLNESGLRTATASRPSWGSGGFSRRSRARGETPRRGTEQKPRAAARSARGRDCG
jgi:hypothetical protein